MGIFDSFTRPQYDDLDSSDEPHEADIGHELLGGAAAFEAARMYEQHCAKKGKPSSHALAKEIMAGFAGVALDRMAETKGADMWSDHQKKQARKQADIQIHENFTETVYEQY